MRFSCFSLLDFLSSPLRRGTKNGGPLIAFSGGLGVELDLARAPAEGDVSDQARLFAESAGRFLVEVAADNCRAFAEIVAGCPVGQLGSVTDGGRIVIASGGATLIDVTIEQAKAAWQGTFAW